MGVVKKNIMLALTALTLTGILPDPPTKDVTPVSVFKLAPVATPTPCPIKEFLAKIAHLESSSGKNTNHRPITKGIHGGTAAVGEHGLMPLTARNIARNSRNPILKPLVGLPPAEVATLLSENEEMAKEAAREYAWKLYRKFQGDQKAMAYGWRMGPNRKPNLNHPYVLAFAEVEVE